MEADMPTNTQSPKIPLGDKEAEDVFTAAHKNAETLEKALEDLETAIVYGRYSEACTAFDKAFEGADDARILLEGKISEMVDDLVSSQDDDTGRHLRQLRLSLAALPEQARGPLHLSNIGRMGPKNVADQCCLELGELERMVSMVENAVYASGGNLPVEMDGAKQVLSYVQYQIALVRNILIDCLPFIQDPEVKS